MKFVTMSICLLVSGKLTFSLWTGALYFYIVEISISLAILSAIFIQSDFFF